MRIAKANFAQAHLRRKKQGRTTRRFRGQAGFTLVELLVVLAILALIATFAAPQVMKYLGRAKTTTAKTQISAIEASLEMYYLDVGAYPPKEIGLKALREAPPGSTKWTGPYLKKESGLLDPWGRAYQYRFPGEHGDFDLMSLGRDGQPGGEGEDKDVKSWE